MTTTENDEVWVWVPNDDGSERLWIDGQVTSIERRPLDPETERLGSTEDFVRFVHENSGRYWYECWFHADAEPQWMWRLHKTCCT
jgi:hypothetical protein